MVIALLLGVTALAAASDHPVPGTHLTLRSNGTRQTLNFRSKGSFTVPVAGSSDDPANAGATLEILNPGTNESFTFDLPKTHWSGAGTSSSTATRRSPRAAR